MSQQTFLLSIVVGFAASVPAFSQPSKPIVDIKIGTNYSQIAASQGDEWAPTWADDDALYTGNDDGSNFGGIREGCVAFGKLVGDSPSDWHGVTISDLGDYGSNTNTQDHANWKTMNSYCVDGALYMFVTRCLYPDQAGDPHHRHIFKNSSIIKSTDKGKTWVRSAEENYNHPMFPGVSFGSPYFVWYGQDGKARVDNAGKYVYAVANNGHFEDGDYYILGRVPKKKLPDLNGGDWQFFTGGDGMKSRNWSTNITSASPILQNELNCSMTGMTYIPSLGRYVMVVWHYITHDIAKDSRTIDFFYEAPKPWGPWTKFKSVDAGDLAWYVPIVSQKFQKKVDANSVDCTLFLTGNYVNRQLYKLNFMPITLSTVPLSEQK